MFEFLRGFRVQFFGDHRRGNSKGGCGGRVVDLLRSRDIKNDLRGLHSACNRVVNRIHRAEEATQQQPALILKSVVENGVSAVFGGMKPDVIDTPSADGMAWGVGRFTGRETRFAPHSLQSHSEGGRRLFAGRHSVPPLTSLSHHNETIPPVPYYCRPHHCHAIVCTANCARYSSRPGIDERPRRRSAAR